MLKTNQLKTGFNCSKSGLLKPILPGLASISKLHQPKCLQKQLYNIRHVSLLITQASSAFQEPQENSPKSFLQRLLSAWNTGIALFLVIGSIIAVSLLQWSSGSALQTNQPYSVYVEYADAPGVRVGTPVRLRGCQVGQVRSVRSTLNKALVEVEVADGGVKLPATSVFDLNRYGALRPDTFIDVVVPPGTTYGGTSLQAGQLLKGRLGGDMDWLCKMMVKGHRDSADEPFH